MNLEKYECSDCGWRCFSEEEYEHHQCGENLSKLSKIKAFVAYIEHAAAMERRARKQKKLRDFGIERRPWYLDHVLGVKS